MCNKSLLHSCVPYYCNPLKIITIYIYNIYAVDANYLKYVQIYMFTAYWDASKSIHNM